MTLVGAIMGSLLAASAGLGVTSLMKEKNSSLAQSELEDLGLLKEELRLILSDPYQCHCNIGSLQFPKGNGSGTPHMISPPFVRTRQKVRMRDSSGNCSEQNVRIYKGEQIGNIKVEEIFLNHFEHIENEENYRATFNILFKDQLGKPYPHQFNVRLKAKLIPNTNNVRATGCRASTDVTQIESPKIYLARSEILMHQSISWAPGDRRTCLWDLSQSANVDCSSTGGRLMNWSSYRPTAFPNGEQVIHSASLNEIELELGKSVGWNAETSMNGSILRIDVTYTGSDPPNMNQNHAKWEIFALKIGELE